MMKKQLQQLQIIHFFLFAVMVAAGMFLVDFKSVELMPKFEEINMVFLAIPLIAFLSSMFLYKKGVETIDKKESSENKLTKYTSICIIRWAMLEGGAFLILFFVPKLIVFAGVLLFYFMTIRPTKENVGAILEINPAEFS